MQAPWRVGWDGELQAVPVERQTMIVEGAFEVSEGCRFGSGIDCERDPDDDVGEAKQVESLHASRMQHQIEGLALLERAPHFHFDLVSVEESQRHMDTEGEFARDDFGDACVLVDDDECRVLPDPDEFKSQTQVLRAEGALDAVKKPTGVAAVGGDVHRVECAALLLHAEMLRGAEGNLVLVELQDHGTRVSRRAPVSHDATAVGGEVAAVGRAQGELRMQPGGADGVGDETISIPVIVR